MARLKTFVAESGFFEVAVAAKSRAAALQAWGMTHSAFTQGFARQTDDAAIVKATIAQPGMVLRRPLGGKGAFTAEAQLPKVKAGPKKSAAKAKAPDRARIRAAEAALEKSEQAHRAQAARLERQREALDAKLAEEDARWQAERARLEAALARARR